MSNKSADWFARMYEQLVLEPQHVDTVLESIVDIEDAIAKIDHELLRYLAARINQLGPPKPCDEQTIVRIVRGWFLALNEIRSLAAINVLYYGSRMSEAKDSPNPLKFAALVAALFGLRKVALQYVQGKTNELCRHGQSVEDAAFMLCYFIIERREIHEFDGSFSEEDWEQMTDTVLGDIIPSDFDDE